MIIGDFLMALAQIGDPRFRGVLLRGVGLTIALLAALFFLLFQGLQSIVAIPPIAGWIGDGGWLSGLLGVTSFVAILGLSVFVMVPVTSAMTSLFLDEVADAVEARHYAHLPPARRTPILEAVKDTLSFLAVILCANLVALFAYALMPPAAPLIFLSLNGYLLGREYFQISAMRRLGREGAYAARKNNAAIIWAAGVLMAIGLLVPFFNLLVPILGAATFTHLFHRLTR